MVVGGDDPVMRRWVSRRSGEVVSRQSESLNLAHT